MKIDLYNSELYRFKVGAFFWHTVELEVLIRGLMFGGCLSVGAWALW